MKRSISPARRATTQLALTLLAVAAMSSPALAGGDSATPATVVYDVAIERPLGIVELASGLAITSVAYPIAALVREGDVVVEQCVRSPGRSTFTRALGRLDEDRRSDCSPVAFSIDMTQLSIGAALQPLTWIFGGSPFHPSRGRDDGVEI